MKKIESQYKEQLQDCIATIPQLQSIIDAIKDAGATVLLVGGAVRDLLLEKKTKDLDIEVHGITLEQLQTVLEAFGPVSLVGKSFGVLRLHAIDIDWSLPRTDMAGRKPTVTIDPHMGYKDAFERRDLTMNAMGIDLHRFELIDPFNAKQDIENKTLRTPNKDFFIEDPLRFFRVMQFIGRFAMYPDNELNDLCTTMDITTISCERIEQEFHKLLLKSERPSLGVRWLYEIGRLHEILPELHACIGVKQDPAWHPEGDVFEHTMQALDAAADIAQKYEDEFQKLILLYAALCHDLGKIQTTKGIDGVYKSLDHETVGADVAKRMLKRITHNTNLIAAVTTLVLYHMQPVQFIANNAKLSAYKRLAKKLAPHATLALLADLALADKRGRNAHDHIPLTSNFNEIDLFVKKATQAQVLFDLEKPILKGTDIIDLVAPGPQMGTLLAHAYEIQIEEGIKDKELLKERVAFLIGEGKC